MRNSYFKGFQVSAMTMAVMMVMSTHAQAADFVANDIAITGLQRVTIESLQSVLPFRLGQVVSEAQLADGVKALYATGNFSDVQVYHQEGRIIYQVTERPLIAEINFEGNRLIPKEGLQEGLKNAGLAVGQPLKQATVQMIETELANQYISQGYYNTEITVKQTMLDGNRVKLDMTFAEGKPARVVDINIIGNQHFSDADLIDVLAIKDNKINPLSKADRYTQEKLVTSLENLRAKYLNAGFVRFEIKDAKLNINEDKNRIFVEISLHEGEQYRFGQTQFLGNLTYTQAELEALLKFKAEDGFSQAMLEQTTNNISAKFGDDGYYYAQIRPVTRINDETRTVDVEYYIDPVRPVYVRRINFTGNFKTQDEVLRREMRQLEGALASNQKIQLSRARLMRTGFFKNVTVDTRPVPNSPDQVDVNFVVEEQPSGSSTIAAGYSQSGGVTFQFDVSQNNFMGTGKRVNASFSRSETREVYSLGMTNPYFTVNGVSQSLSGYYRKTKYDNKNISNYVLDSYGGSLSYGYPIDENQRISFGLNADNTKLRGGRFMGISNVKQLMADGGKIQVDNNGIPDFKHDYTTYNATLGWNYSSLDRPVFPTQGMSHSVDLTVGFGDKTHQKVVYQGNIYRPFVKKSVLRGYAKLGYGNNLPFYENFYAGGYGSVRGYDQSSLGPRSQAYLTARRGQQTTLGEVVGGNALATFGSELILPLPFKGDWIDQVRPVIFIEGGQVFDTTGMDKQTIDLTQFKDPQATAEQNAKAANRPLLTQDKQLRYSAGVGATWYTPIGPLSISYAKPLNKKQNDQTDTVQFQIGSVF
ncbi:outer membrane protein assembly factor BamA [Moraxella catarrhalis]|uniref:outer membrane protein assembly factor BamA n=1 Tax=Moraxella catarrhalis TaxID=480 RepID=UPI0007E495C0|nr:outer membrane protein assembly factor BamA [Moraxella catarrhalis]MPW64520.1 outer membrane protein assembly factor BamA [Moraxella catarrhalis]OAV12470.1 Outer membrane protein assembly factor YaeT precursor [Moraxella catarrhalis]OAV16810.1 Outer membrane protein assembly factor YaeT precursor [Moraxella catarrhalis]OAV22350.1 Outer membrane protein assembly factor YaeT precursor [Moraxella catarrhalis]OBX44991.1 outer membrane protein assembly factor BamA [Moraxella catarrhalis]